MTKTQYKNKIRSTLADKSLKGLDSVEVARKLFKNCGITLPQGSCKDILNTLKSDDFVGWRSCTQDEAQQYANEGTPAIGLTDKKIVVIEPEGDKSSIKAVSLDENVIPVSTVSALFTEENMVYFASTMSSTTTTPEEEHTIRVEGIPDDNQLVMGEGMTLTVYCDDRLTWPGWDYDPTMWHLYEQIIHHTTISHFFPLKTGTTTLTATARARTLSYSFDITVHSCKISFNANGGSVSPSYLTINSSSANEVTLPTPNRTDHICMGWFTAPTGGTKVGDPGDLYSVTSSITVYAQWLYLRQRLLTSNACYISGQYMPEVKGIMVHSTGVDNPNLKRYVGPDDGLLGFNQNYNHWNVYHPGYNVNGIYSGPHTYVDNNGVCNTCGGRRVCVHAFIGQLEDGTIATYQTLPWNMEGWHGGSGVNGRVNDTHIGFEVCELRKYNNYTTPAEAEEYFNSVYQEAVKLCAYLCKLYNINPLQKDKNGGIISHQEGHNLGIATGHEDIDHWFADYGVTMDMFRADVAAIM